MGNNKPKKAQCRMPKRHVAPRLSKLSGLPAYLTYGAFTVAWIRFMGVYSALSQE